MPKMMQRVAFYARKIVHFANMRASASSSGTNSLVTAKNKEGSYATLYARTSEYVIESWTSDPLKPSTADFGMLYSRLAPCITVKVSPASEMIFQMSYPSLDRTFLCMTRSQCSITGSDMSEL
jgi:hypothetical protein